VQVKYFDTVPPCASIAVLKTGFLFAASEYGNHALYQFIVSVLSQSKVLKVCTPALYFLCSCGFRAVPIR